MLPPVQQKASTRHNCVSRARHTHGAAHTAAGLSCQPLGAPKLAQHTSHQPRRRRGAAHTAAGLSCQPLVGPKLAQRTTHPSCPRRGSTQPAVVLRRQPLVGPKLAQRTHSHSRGKKITSPMFGYRRILARQCQDMAGPFVILSCLSCCL